MAQAHISEWIDALHKHLDAAEGINASHRRRVAERAALNRAEHRGAIAAAEHEAAVTVTQNGARNG